ncbi:MAG: DUF434 domain-containing protein [Phycisphaerae bacterium]|jgi:hypothetical protein
MPDKRRHRGPHPDDDRLFHTSQLPRLRQAVAEFSWLLSRAYAPDSAVKLVGDHHGLSARQRMAVQRAACSDEALQRRLTKRVLPSAVSSDRLGIDGYNLIITVESALSGALVFIARDGSCRDIASIHGTYRKVDETRPAIDLIIDQVVEVAPHRVDWYLDRPVSNSGRLKARIADALETRRTREPDPTARAAYLLGSEPQPAGSPGTVWNIELVDSPDRVLAEYDGVVATTDSAVLDRCNKWVNLAAEVVQAEIPAAWQIDLRAADDPT